MRKMIFIIISIIVLIAIFTLAIPMFALAKTPAVGVSATNGYSLSSDKLLLSLDNFADTTVETKEGITLDSQARTGDAAVTPNGDDLTITAKKRTWYSYIRRTSLPLTGDEQYTITYTGHIPCSYEGITGNEWTLIGFSFYMDSEETKAGEALTLWKSVNSSHPDVLKLLDENMNAHRANFNIGEPIPNTDDFSGEHDFLISIDGKNISFYMDGKFLGTLGGSEVEYSKTGKLTLGMRMHADNSSTETDENNPFTLYSMSDIKVYEGAYTEKTNVVAMQYCEAVDGKQSIRFISTLDSLEGTEVGFNISAVYEDDKGIIYSDKSWNVKSTAVYSSIVATNKSGTVADVTAEELGGNYLIALAINDVPTNYEQMDFYVESYVIVDGEASKSQIRRFTMSNGVAVEGVTTSNSEFDVVQGVPNLLEGKPFDGLYDSYDGAAMMYWKNTTEDMMVSYTQILEENGFTKHQELNNSSIKTATYFKDNSSVHTYYLKRTKEFRVITQNDDYLPVNAYEYEKKCDVAVTQLDIFHDASTYIGMAYLIRLEDGTFVIIDGGDRIAANAELLYNTMREQLPAGVDDIVISAWIMTHGHHADHSGVLKEFIFDYSDKVTVKRLIGNDVSDLEFEKLNGVRSFDYDSVIGNFGGCVYDKVHTGEQYFFPGVTFTILHTDEDVYPVDMWNYNDTSVVFDAKINTTGLSNSSEDGVIRFIWFGDIGSQPSGDISEMYAEDLKCDVLQICHHGIGGNHVTLYTLCSPQIAYWPAGETVVMYKDEQRKKDPSNNKVLVDSARIIYSYQGTNTMVIKSDSIKETQENPKWSLE